MGYVPVSSLPVCLSVSRLVFHLGGPGLVLLGLLDNSVIPTPAAQDVVTALLAASFPDWWLYYALMATVGALIGGFLTFRLGRKGGEAAMEGHISRKKVEMVTQRFKSWGWGAVILPALLPPPFPASPFFFAAGALKYPVKKYVVLLGIGRSIRYLAVAYLASEFGSRIVRLLRQSGKLLFVSVGIMIAGGLIFTLWYLRKKHMERSRSEV